MAACHEEASALAAAYACEEAAANDMLGQVDAAFAKALDAAITEDASYSSVMSRKNEPVDPKFLVAPALKQAQEGWLQYLKNQCRAEGETRHGGSGTDSINSLCRYRLAKQRLAELETTISLIQR
ncbi:MAG: DUF1311 domain-containing protein [Sphingomonadaceae bacterium]|nr:DUF1311 domain-containing protein [Sphingomonadaceae bacterium]MCP5384579.1 DUF1311 domain-containing protein [Altererythrobacter sp.]MCP5392231.1 DUF1311 domain-containing protein [Sphingomonadaceae bacterium]